MKNRIAPYIVCTYLGLNCLPKTKEKRVYRNKVIFVDDSCNDIRPSWQ